MRVVRTTAGSHDDPGRMALAPAPGRGHDRQMEPSVDQLSRPTRRSVAVEVMVCGSPDRGDDGAPAAALRRMRGELPLDVTIRAVGELDVDDLLAIAVGAGVVVVDAVVGIPVGSVISWPLTGLIGQGATVHMRSSKALALPEVVGVAEMIRGHPLRGRIVAIGGGRFRLGRGVSRPVAAGLAAFSDAILDAIRQVRPVSDPEQRDS